MVRGFEVSHLLGEMNIRNADIHPNWNDIRSTADMNKLSEIVDGEHIRRRVSCHYLDLT
jgi:hypothetical protein